jgi:hypothetical protein
MGGAKEEGLVQVMSVMTRDFDVQVMVIMHMLSCGLSSPTGRNGTVGWLQERPHRGGQAEA